MRKAETLPLFKEGIIYDDLNVESHFGIELSPILDEPSS